MAFLPPAGVHISDEDREIGALILKLDFHGIIRNAEICAELAEFRPRNWEYTRGRAAEVFTADQMRKIDAATAAAGAAMFPERGTVKYALERTSVLGAAELLLANAVDAAIKANDLNAVYSTIVPLAPGVTLGAWMQCRAQLKRHFRSALGVTTLDKAVAIERRKPRRTGSSRQAVLAIRDAGTIGEWHAALEVLRLRFPAPAWFLARDVAALARSGELKLPGYLGELLGELKLPGYLGETIADSGRLARSIGRALAKHVGQTYDGLRLAGGFDAHSRLGRWRVQVAGAAEELAPVDDSMEQWEKFLETLAGRQGAGWFDGAGVAVAVRSGEIAELPDSIGDVDPKREGGLERAINRSFTRRLGINHGERGLHLARQHNCERDVLEWRVESRGEGCAEK